MWDVTFGLADQLEAATRRVSGFLPGLPTADELDHVVVMGMGGSGIAGDVLAALAGPSSPVPVIVVKDPAVPGVRRAALAGHRAVLLRHDGRDHRRRLGGVGAGRLPRLGDVGRATGRAAPRRAGAACWPSIRPSRCREPASGRSWRPCWRWPRTPASSTAPASSSPRPSCSSGGGRRRCPAPGTWPRSWPARIGRTWPLVYGAGPLGAVAAVRWKNQVNENAKAPAFCHTLPEVCHNELCGWGQHGDVTRQVLTLVELRHGFESDDIGRRFELMDDQMLEVVGRHLRRRGRGRRAAGAAHGPGAGGRRHVAAPGRRRRGRPRPHPGARRHEGRSGLGALSPVSRRQRGSASDLRLGRFPTESISIRWRSGG